MRIHISSILLIMSSVTPLLASGDEVSLNALCPSRDDAAIVGVAQAQQGDELLYCEYHYLKNAQSQPLPAVSSMGEAVFATVEYRDQAQQRIARKAVDFSADSLAPNIEQIDDRHGEQVIMQTQAPGQVRIQYTAANSTDSQQATINSENPLVVDAGFDNTIRQYWKDIVNNKKVIVEFVAPVQQTSVNLSIKSRNIDRCNQLSQVVSFNSDAYVCVTAQAANVILNWFVEPITLVYARDNQRLMMFSGAVNITDKQGKGQSATIHYYYQ